MEVVNKIELKKITEIKPYIRNPRKNDKTVKLLVDIIPRVGFNVPILIDKNGVIVKGHARYTAAIRLGMKEVPCVVTEADEETVKLDRIADNKISEFSEWMTDGLMHELDMLNVDFDLGELGLPTQSAEEFTEFECQDAAEEDNEYGNEERKRKFQEMLEQQENRGKEVEIVTEKQLEKAREDVKKIATPPKYYKCTCEKCGHTMFVREDMVVDV